MAKSVIKFARLREVRWPERGHEHDAGIDFFVPKFDASFMTALKNKNDLEREKENCCDGQVLTYTSVGAGTLTLSGGEKQAEVKFDLADVNESMIKFDEEKGKNYFLLAPLSRIAIPSGIYCRMETPDRALIAHNKSGVTSDYGLIFGAQVVDYEYQGEVHISVINASPKVVRIYEDQKLQQFIEMPIYTSKIETFDRISELWPEGETARKDGGFGSTDKKDIQPLNS